MKTKHILWASIVIYLIGLLDDSYLFIAEKIPVLLKTVKLYNSIFTCTENGPFCAFAFMALGLYIAEAKPKISCKKSGIMFGVSLIVLLLEVLLVTQVFNVAENSRYILLLPATYYLFMFTSQIKTKNTSDKCTLRALSRLIYYTHPMVIFIYFLAFKNFGNLPSLLLTFLGYLAVTISTIILSYIIIKLSEIKGFKWLKKIF